MMTTTLQKFISTFVNIEYHKEERAFGYRPYNFFVTGQDDKSSAGALVGLPGSEANYGAVARFLKEKPKIFFLAMDFPPFEEIQTDFVAIFSYIQSDDLFECTALPYNNKTGVGYPLLSSKGSPTLKTLLKEFLTCVAATNISSSR